MLVRHGKPVEEVHVCWCLGMRCVPAIDVSSCPMAVELLLLQPV